MSYIHKHLTLASIERNLLLFARHSGSETEAVQQFRSKLKDKCVNIPEINRDDIANDVTNSHVFKVDLPQFDGNALLEKANVWSRGYTDEPMVSPTQQDSLSSIFNGINGGKGTYIFAPSVLTTKKEHIFPQKVANDPDLLSNYKALWMSFLKEFEQLPTTSLQAFTESLLFLLKKYTWSIPLDHNQGKQISLFEYIKNSAALTNCLAKGLLDNDSKAIHTSPADMPLLLVGGDLSGIQKFIYNIASRKAAVSLKGRSFYLQLLTDALISQIIHHPDIDVTIANVVYASGGKFYLLLPHSETILKTLTSIQARIDKELWKDHHGLLAMNVCAVPFGYTTDMTHIIIEEQPVFSLGDLWKKLSDKLTAAKNKKFNSLLTDSFKDLFEPHVVDADTRVCAVTGIEGKCEPLDRHNEDNEAVHVLPSVKRQAELGRKLKDANILMMQHSTKENDLNVLDTSISLYASTPSAVETLSASHPIQVRLMNNTDFLNNPLNNQDVCYGFQFYGGNRQAVNDKNRNKTFEELAKDSYLGVLRMDVDNLGAIFIKGLPEEDKSFSAYSTLSFLLDLFFSGYLNEIRTRYKNDVNILYSGGDDVFAIGEWSSLLDFARDIRKDFAAFTGRNDISISGGIAVVGEKFPIAKAAEIAGEAEEQAKQFLLPGKLPKNAITFFGESISWEDEFDEVEAWKNRFVKLCRNKDQPLPTAILHKLMTYGTIAKSNSRKEKEGKSKDLSVYWRSAYYLKRFEERHKNNEEAKRLKEDIVEKLFSAGNARNFELLAVAARWAELTLRNI